MKRFKMLVGCSGSGKSTYAEQLIKEDNTFVELNRDTVRFNEFTGGNRCWLSYKFNKANEKKVTEIIDGMADYWSGEGLNLICSDTNINPKSRKKWEGWCLDNDYELEIITFNVKWDELVKRNSQRQGGLPEHRLWGMYKSYMQQFGKVGDYTLETYKPDKTLCYTSIVDIDGTVAQMTDRKPFDWDKVGQDLPRSSIINMVCAEGLRNGHITFLSGRDGCCYEDTKEWIEHYIMDSTMEDVSWDLYMRAPDDWRKDDIVKYELFDEHIRGKYNISSVFDDRYSIVRLWSLLNLPNIIQVGEYNNEF